MGFGVVIIFDILVCFFIFPDVCVFFFSGCVCFFLFFFSGKCRKESTRILAECLKKLGAHVAHLYFIIFFKVLISNNPVRSGKTQLAISHMFFQGSIPSR